MQRPIAEQIRLRREDLGLTQAEAGRRAGVAQSWWAQWEGAEPAKGARTPSAERMPAIAEALRARWVSSAEGWSLEPLEK
ncbi:MAG TPA: helix-turn-helix transcriptional regulator [bacterium]|nr:helix-turn-helix transcriptional regulator [bacterium]